MQNFEFHTPTKIIFGTGILDRLGETAAVYGKKALFLYGRESIKRSGLYDQVVAQFAAARLEFREHGGVQPNPILSHAEAGIVAAREFGAEFIVAVGGGSVIDEAKGIAAGFSYDGDLWDLYSRKAGVERALPIIAVQTLPATSSENNAAAVLTNPATNEKFGLRSDHIIPRVAFLDPSLTLSIPYQYTAFAGFDIMSHLLEGYFTSTDPFAPVSEGFVEGTVRAVMLSLERLKDNPADLEARSALMWAGALGWNGLCTAGVEGARIPNHMLAHPLGALYDVPHGAALAVIFPVWLRYFRERLAARILLFGRRILEMGPELDGREPSEACDQVIDRFAEWIRAVGCPASLAELGVDDPDFTELTSQAEVLASYWNIKDHPRKDIEALYRTMV